MVHWQPSPSSEQAVAQPEQHSTSLPKHPTIHGQSSSRRQFQRLNPKPQLLAETMMFLLPHLLSAVTPMSLSLELDPALQEGLFMYPPDLPMSLAPLLLRRQLGQTCQLLQLLRKLVLKPLVLGRTSRFIALVLLPAELLSMCLLLRQMEMGISLLRPLSLKLILMLMRVLKMAVVLQLEPQLVLPMSRFTAPVLRQRGGLYTSLPPPLARLAQSSSRLRSPNLMQEKREVVMRSEER